MTDLADAPATNERRVPWHLRGNFAPVVDEVTLTDLNVVGSIPAALQGMYVRNGANPRSGDSPHWFFGDGMLHGLQLDGGQAKWFRNRYVRTPKWAGEDIPMIDENFVMDRTASAANTHVIHHAGRILGLEEAHFPYEVNRQLETIGAHTFGGKLKTAMTAHPKVCPETDEMMFFGYGQLPPYLTYHRVSATGELVQSTEIDVKGPTMMHDFVTTRNYTIFMDLPVIFDLDLALSGSMPFRWEDSYGARIGVMPRAGTNADVTWFDVEPCYVFHPMNAYESNGSVMVDVGRFRSMWRKDSSDFDEFANLHRWEFNLTTGGVKERQLDDRPAEFARVADDRVGLENRYGYMTATRPQDRSGLLDTRLLKYDLRSGECAVHDCGPGRRPGEAVFVADPSRPAGGQEDAGWVMTYVHDDSTDTTDLVIIDATDFTAGPVAAVKLPRRIPFGFHGSWVPGLG